MKTVAVLLVGLLGVFAAVACLAAVSSVKLPNGWQVVTWRDTAASDGTADCVTPAVYGMLWDAWILPDSGDPVASNTGTFTFTLKRVAPKAEPASSDYIDSDITSGAIGATTAALDVTTFWPTTLVGVGGKLRAAVSGCVDEDGGGAGFTLILQVAPGPSGSDVE